MLVHHTDIKVTLKENIERKIMRVIDRRFRLVNNAPARVQNALSDPHVLEYLQVVRETRDLPHFSPNRRVRVRKMIILVAEVYSIHRHLDDSRSAVHYRERRSPLHPRFRFRQLPPVDCSDSRFVEIAQKRRQPRPRCRYRVLRQEHQDLSLCKTSRIVSRSRVMERLRRNSLDPHWVTSRDLQRIVRRARINHNHLERSRTLLRINRRQTRPNILRTILRRNYDSRFDHVFITAPMRASLP